MTSLRKVSINTGVLFVVATAAALAAGAAEPALTGTEALRWIAAHPGRLAAAALLYLVAAGTSVGIAVALYPVLRTVNTGLALGSVVFRTIEAVFYSVAVVTLLSLRPLAEQLVATPPGDGAPSRAAADLLLGARDHASVVGVLAFCVGAMLYYLLLHRSRLVPRWLTGWGMAGVLLLAVAGLLALFTDHPVTGYTLLVLPIGVQEMALAAWLLAKGFREVSAPAGAR